MRWACDPACGGTGRSADCSPPPETPFQSFRSGTQALREGKVDQGVAELERAARLGVTAAIWKLGRMYADGDGVVKDKARAFEYFRHLTNHPQADDSVGTPQARFVANAFVSLEQYYLEEFRTSWRQIRRWPTRCSVTQPRISPTPKAQYNLGRLYLNGRGAPKDAIQAARWLQLAANKGEHRAQALLGGMLFRGKDVSRKAALGLFWLIVAKDSAGADEGWITDTYKSAFVQATDEERALAYKYSGKWLKTRRE